MSNNVFTKKTALALAGILLLVAGCREAAGPTAFDAPESIAMLASLAGDDGEMVEPHILRQGDTASALQTYEVRFWVSKREGGRVTVDYVNGDPSTTEVNYDHDVGSHTFLSLYVPAGAIARLPDGRPLGPRDSVEITVTIDPVLMYASMQPSGLIFKKNKPAELYVSYARADGDYDRDGDVDTFDIMVEESFLGVWVRDGATSPWFPVTAEHSAQQRWFLAYLEHFSDHAISW